LIVTTLGQDRVIVDLFLGQEVLEVVDIAHHPSDGVLQEDMAGRIQGGAIWIRIDHGRIQGLVQEGLDLQEVDLGHLLRGLLLDLLILGGEVTTGGGRPLLEL
jgi:hypothetical protein